MQLFHLGAVTEFDLSIQVSFFKSKPNMMTVEKRNIIEVLGQYLGIISIQAKKTSSTRYYCVLDLVESQHEGWWCFTCEQ